jgi:PAS domain-containing protein
MLRTGFEGLTAGATLACVAFDDAGTVLWANARFCAMLGLGPGGAAGRSYWELTTPGQRNRELNEITQGRHGFEKEFVDPGGAKVGARVVGVSRGREGPTDVNVVWCLPSADGAVGGGDAGERDLRRQNAALLALAREGAVDAGRLDGAFTKITEAASEGIGCERASVWLFDESESTIVCQDLFERSRRTHGARGFELTARDYPGYFEALREDRTIAADDARRHPATREFTAGYLEPLGITSMLEAPVRRGGKLVGVLCNEHVGPARAFTPQEAAFAASVADYVGRALEADARRRADDALKDAHAALARHATELEQRVAERTRALRLLLDTTGEGFVAFDRAGLVVGEQSRAAHEWFGAPGPTAAVEGYVFAGNPKASIAFRLGLEQLAEGELPPELLLDQMPRELARDGREYLLSYRPIDDDGETRWVLVVRDATRERAMERAELEARELQAVAGHALRDRAGLSDFVRETERLLAGLDAAPDSTAFRRALHTLKGNAATYGLASLASLAHAAEAEFDGPGRPMRSALARPLAELWRRRRARIDEAFGERPAGIELGEAEYHAFLSRVAERAPHGELLRAAESWPAVRLGSLAARLGRQAEGIASRLGKQVHVAIEGADLRLPDGHLGAFLAELGHLVRNAVDHGIEPPGERAALGKPREGRLTIGAAPEADGLRVWVEDDGRGVDWGAVARRARGLGLLADARDALELALFADRLTTRDAASELSGRGVGLAAVAAACARAGGRAAVTSTPGEGTRFDFRFPRAAFDHLPAPARERPSVPVPASARPPGERP